MKLLIISFIVATTAITWNTFPVIVTQVLHVKKKTEKTTLGPGGPERIV